MGIPIIPVKIYGIATTSSTGTANAKTLSVARSHVKIRTGMRQTKYVSRENLRR
jgi:hypothetical protein